MRKKIIGILVLAILILMTIISSTFAYSDDIFECDLPSSYANVKYQNTNIFTDSNMQDRGFVIMAQENTKIKKSVWDIDQSDVEKLVNTMAKDLEVIKTDKRVKLGKEKAVKLIVMDDGNYMELYLLASNKYIYTVVFMGESQEDLNNEDYKMIKDSFKLKDSTTNFKFIYILIIVIASIVSMYIRARKLGKI